MCTTYVGLLRRFTGHTPTCSSLRGCVACESGAAWCLGVACCCGCAGSRRCTTSRSCGTGACRVHAVCAGGGASMWCAARCCCDLGRRRHIHFACRLRRFAQTTQGMHSAAGSPSEAAAASVVWNSTWLARPWCVLLFVMLGWWRTPAARDAAVVQRGQLLASDSTAQPAHAPAAKCGWCCTSWLLQLPWAAAGSHGMLAGVYHIQCACCGS
jgi:hypothetical protein